MIRVYHLYDISCEGIHGGGRQCQHTFTLLITPLQRYQNEKCKETAAGVCSKLHFSSERQTDRFSDLIQEKGSPGY